MTRTIPPSLAGIMGDLELEQPTLVTSDHLAELVHRHGVLTPPKVVAARLRDRGWLLSTGRRGVWEFAPAAVAGAFSLSDPVMPLRAFLASRPGARCALTFQAAAWAHGVADRVPSRLEVAAATADLARQLPSTLAPSAFDPRLDYVVVRGAPVLAPESVVVHMATRPADVRSWASVLEWLPELAGMMRSDALSRELEGRSASITTRTGYLLQGLRPDIATSLHARATSKGKVWFGRRASLKRHDAYWQIADTLLPFDPRTLEAST
ncbi:type IV toxin-antitoxin system AbiEi family antitoxin [Demequina sp.]|uniref:type IV toxin-antitoxin system AbiEi family antitoxin n=1 Tax=Demequina sp. TaxID=2050685 RepID=UPI0025C0E1CE|nr:type IV toxin-antitoxin system AbiEi family antitoxin [Demequina sp.]